MYNRVFESAVKKLLDIPADEPIFVLRASDDLSVEALWDYMDTFLAQTKKGRLPTSQEKLYKDEIDNLMDDFDLWRRKNSSKCKFPQ